MSELEFNIDNTKTGFRLHSVELLNWGTFHNKIWKIEPHGNNSLLTGDVGSGKSTLVDALTCLIVPHYKISFNKAAGAEKNERSLLTYIKGEYKNTKNDDNDSREKAVSLRYNNQSDSTFSVIVANFTNEGYRESVSLAQVFWIENDKPQKFLIIREKFSLSIKENFSNIEDAKELRKRMKDLPNTEIFDDNFSKYSQRFRHLFGMQTDKAIDLFYQTVSMKSVSSLTFFVREQMLERTEIKSQIEDLKKRFDDLNKAYEAVQLARRQKETLEPLVDFCKSFREFEERIQDIDNIVSAVPSYFASKKISLLEDEIGDCERKLLQITGQLSSIEELLNTKRDNLNQIKQNIRSNGGERLEKIAEEIQAKEKLAENKKGKHKEYSELTSLCELETANTDKTFFKNKKNAEEKVEALKTRQDEILSEIGKIAGAKSTVEEYIQAESRELESLKQRENQIPLEFLNIRGQLSDALEIDEEEIPFAGELLRVNEHEEDWEGALERLLRGFGVSLLVPEKHYSQISNYINQKRLIDNRNKGMRFEYFKVPYSFKQSKYAEVDIDSVVYKIEIKSDSPFESWLENELQKRFNLRCVSLDEFQRLSSDVITKEGQYKVGNQRHIKDDRRDLWDRRNFVLGWSNQEKIKAVEKHLNQLRISFKEFEDKEKDLKTENKNNSIIQNKLSQLLGYKNWFELNWKDEIEAITKLENERNELQDSNNILKTLQEKLIVVQSEITEQEKLQKEKLGDERSLKDKVKEYGDEVTECTSTVNTLLQGEKEKFYPKIEQEIKDITYTIKNIDKVRDNLVRELNEERKRVSGRQNTVRDKIIQKMREYKDKFPSDSLELSDDIEARGEYLYKLEKIINEGLPVHEATLKTMLNKNTIDDIVAFDNKLDIHEKEIRIKIKNINEHLREIEFNKGTYIELIADRNRDQEIKIFKEDLKACYSNILDTNDAYTENRFNDVQKILNRFRSNENKDIDWTNKVTDVRNWFDFNASERYFVDNSEKEFYAGSSGKSGGQKEKLAYTIIASALAYQFGLKIGEPKSKSFRFAVIDEAFGKGSDSSAEYGLELFKKLNLQLLIVTPLQKIHVIENYISSVNYVSNTEGNNSEIQNLTIEEYKDKKFLYNTNSKIEVVEAKE
ncbi:ATP-binding protein [Limnovirga soli]|uniref:ATP-dependent exonuclease SbcCD, C subunit-like protein n=1 Tax=Limnovirga soli TaxID=2656915 RepID=A0A8J8FFP2_9BACT|nr:ATP-binding protein [Limnovirga soli]NNV55051.1 ATP-dependent exonuclease SbcCD, C subunit-like protein [Limnovirga soli]